MSLGFCKQMGATGDWRRAPGFQAGPVLGAVPPAGSGRQRPSPRLLEVFDSGSCWAGMKWLRDVLTAECEVLEVRVPAGLPAVPGP